RDPVEGQRSFRSNKGGKRGGRLQEEAAGEAIGADLDDPRNTVDVTGNEVAAKLLAGPQRALKIDAPARPPLTERGARHGLIGAVDGNACAGARPFHAGDREAGPVTADRRPEGNAIGAIAAKDAETSALAREQLADICNDAGEHRRQAITPR